MTSPEPASRAGADLSGRVVLVTGAAGAIGRAVRGAFERAGATTWGVDLRADQDVGVCDTTDEAAVEDAFATAARVGPVTDVVHAVGAVAVGRLADMALEDVERVIRVNLLSSFVVARTAAARLPAGGTLTMLSSQAGVHGAPNWSVYCASKAGVLRLVESLAKELGPRGVRVNAVCPGSVDTPLMDDVIAVLAALEGVASGDVRRHYEDAVPLRRLARPEEVAGVCVFLASPGASYVNGAAVMVDGGERPG